MPLKTIFGLVFICLLFTTCKKKNDDNSVDTAEKLATIVTLDNKAIEIYGATLAATHDSVAAINALGQWLLDQPDVKEAYYWSTAMIEIHFQNGLTSSIAFVKGNASGHHYERGAGGGKELKRFKNADIATEKIRNNKVLILNPFLDEFYDGAYTKKPMFQGGVDVMDVQVFEDNQVTYSLLNTMGEYGLVILNTHGFPNGFVLSKLFDLPVGDSITAWSRDQLLNELVTQGNIPIEKFESSEFILDMLVRVDDYVVAKKTALFLVSEKFIRNSSLNMEGAVVFGNHCHSGYTLSGPTVNNMPEAWRSKGVSTYYGYAFPNGSSSLVWETFAGAMEDTLIRSLVKHGDSTGVAHLKNNVTKLFDNTTFPDDPANLKLPVQRSVTFKPVVGVGSLEFTQFYDKEYAYEECEADTLTDIRDGQKYNTVCIGEQLWMAENLNWAGAGKCYDDIAANCDTYGRMYQWPEANHDSSSTTNPSGVRGVCPAGWHMPSEAEWVELFDYLGGRMVAGGKMKSTSLLWSQPNVGATNSSGFSALPGGYMDSSSTVGLNYVGLGGTAIFWSATEEDALESYRRTLFDDLNEAAVGSYVRKRWVSVRCVKD